MQQNLYYDIGKNGSYADISKNYIWRAEIDILKGLKDREDHKDRRDLLIKLCHAYNSIFYNTCLLGIRCFVDYMLDVNIPKYELNCGLKNACQGGHRDIVDLLIQKGADTWNGGLQGACYGGHKDLVDLMIKKGANDWNLGLAGACLGGHVDLVDLMIQKGANHWNYGLRRACEGGYRDIVDLLIEKGADDWDRGLGGACQRGHLGLVKYMVEKGANNYDSALDITCIYKHWEIVEYFIMIGIENIKKDKNYYKYLSRKLKKSKPSLHGLYDALDDLVYVY